MANPHQLDRVLHSGLDTVWKCFKRSVWKNPDKPFIGERQKTYVKATKYNATVGKCEYGEYVWQTFQETDDVVEALSRAIIRRELCPLVRSDTEGTPDLKFIGIFSENRM
jgi:hypothetical protein